MSYNYLKFIDFSELEDWSASRYLQNQFDYNKKYNLMKIKEFLTRNKTVVQVEDDIEYKRVTIKINNGGVFLRDKKFGRDIGTKKQFLIRKSQFLLSKIDARNGAFGVVTDEVDNAIITGNFWTYDVDYIKINPHFLSLIATTKQFIKFCEQASNGTTNRHYLQEDIFLDVKIPLPSLEEQEEIVNPIQENLAEQTVIENNIKTYIREFEREIFLKESIGIQGEA